MFEVITGELRAKLLIAHVGPLTRAWAARPTLLIAGLRAIERVNARNCGFACEYHTTTDTVAPKTQTTSPLAARFQGFSPRWSAIWALHHHKSRPRRRQSGGIALHGGPTRRRHAARRLRVVQNPHRHQPEVRRIDYKSWAQHRLARKNRPTPPLQWHFREKIRPARPLQWLFREKVLPARVKTPNLGQFERTGRTFSRFHDLTATQGELFRACRRSPSSALPISDRAPLAWRAPEGTEGLAAVPVGGGGAWSRQISHAIPPGHESMHAQKPQNIND